MMEGDASFLRFDTIWASDGQTDRQTDGHVRFSRNTGARAIARSVKKMKIND